MEKMIEKEVDGALHMLLHCAFKDKEYVTQTQQYEIVYRYILSLETKLEEKDKVIDEILNNPFFTNECPYSLIGYEFIQKLCDCDNCEEEYKKCWLKYFENKVLERGKNSANIAN